MYTRRHRVAISPAFLFVTATHRAAHSSFLPEIRTGPAANWLRLPKTPKTGPCSGRRKFATGSRHSCRHRALSPIVAFLFLCCAAVWHMCSCMCPRLWQLITVSMRTAGMGGRACRAKQIWKFSKTRLRPSGMC